MPLKRLDLAVTSVSCLLGRGLTILQRLQVQSDPGLFKGGGLAFAFVLYAIPSQDIELGLALIDLGLKAGNVVFVLAESGLVVLTHLATMVFQGVDVVDLGPGLLGWEGPKVMAAVKTAAGDHGIVLLEIEALTTANFLRLYQKAA